ncbi:beta-ketoacyl reductase [Microbispora sp. CA-102843]|uniref:beta-ketoacyl reductase n=1 Tax=Microbispora sp. CA-102843 TaxID=3239952 RepID=UPI003D94A30D
MTTGSQQFGVDEVEDSPRILTLHWEKTGAFEPRYGAAETSWVVQSWGPSRCADEFSSVLRAGDPQVSVIREDVSAASAGASPVPGDDGREQRYVFFIDETPPLADLDLTGKRAWAWAHAVVRACQHVASRPGARLWIVTRTGLHGPRRGDTVRPEQDFAWALGRCHAAESPDSWGGLVDVSVDDPRTASEMLAAYLLSGSSEDEVLLHNDGPFVARLTASMLPPPASGQGISMERLHIVSGGVMGLSFEIERCLARSGAKRLLILGRTPLDDDRKRNLRRLQSMGCTVDYEVLDVGDPEQVRRLTARLRGEAIGGVFHLASHWRAGGRSCVASLQSATPDQTQVLIGAKANGALLLSELAEELEAEALVLFSSAAATLGSPGQANYAAANAVLDGVARRLHGGRVRPVSIAWGPVGEVGFGATREGADLHESWERLGLRRLTVDQVLSTVSMALSQDEPNLAVVAWDDSALAALPWFRERPVLEPLADVEPVGLSLEHLSELEDGRRLEFIVEVIQGHLAAMLSRAPADVDPDQPLLDMGIDSLIALELLFIVDREFAVRLELHEVLVDTDATLMMMAEKLDERIRSSDQPILEGGRR